MFFLGMNILHSQSIYGASLYGGADSIGTIFKLNSEGEILNSFELERTKGANPIYTNLIEAESGALYGTTAYGGEDNLGAIFRYNPILNTYTHHIDFNGINGSYPHGGLVQISDGRFFGMTISGGSSDNGVIYEFDPFSNTITVVHNFQSLGGTRPRGVLLEVMSDGLLYGLTHFGGAEGFGTLFSFDPNTNNYLVVDDFNDISTISGHGSKPNGSLIEGSDGNLYGTTTEGGQHGKGVVFRCIAPQFSINPIHHFTTVSGGLTPYGDLLQSNDPNLLYGMTREGGSNGDGVIFQVNIQQGLLTTEADLGGSPFQFSSPTGSLVQLPNGNLCGLTNQSSGGAGFGGAFQYNLSSGTFQGSEFGPLITAQGAFPFGSFCQTSSGKLFGLTAEGGEENIGTLIEYDYANSQILKRLDFGANNNGENPTNLLIADDGYIYGTTAFGGVNVLPGDVSGVLFKYNPSNGIYVKLHDYYDVLNHGGKPVGELIQASNGIIYGTTMEGGATDNGVIYSFDPVTLEYLKIADFDFVTGGDCQTGLTEMSNGNLYGVCSSNGVWQNGDIFEFDISSSTISVVYDFLGGGAGDGSTPKGKLCRASDGKLYGTTFHGGSSTYTGTIFSYDPISSTYAQLYSIDSALKRRRAPNFGINSSE